SQEPADDTNRAVTSLHATPRADQVSDRGLAAQRRDQREQQGGTTDLARRVDELRAGSGQSANAVHDVPPRHSVDPTWLRETGDSSGVAGSRRQRRDRGRDWAEESGGGQPDTDAAVAPVGTVRH